MKSARAVSGILGSGVVVIPALLNGRSGLVVLAITVLVALTLPLAAALFWWRPFGGDSGDVRSVRELPAAPRAIYSIGFLGGSVYFAASAVAVLRALWQVPAWVAVTAVAAAVTVLGQGLARRPLPAAVTGLRCLLALAVAALLPLTAGPAEALGPAAGRLPLPVLALASLLVCVGWEAIPALRLDRATVRAAALICAAAAAATCVWAGATGLRAGLPDGNWDVPVGAVAIGLLILFAAGNTAALAAFWPSGAARSGAARPNAAGSGAARSALRTGQLWAAVAVFTGYAALAGSGADRGWSLLLPGLATLVLYTGFALRRWPADADRAGVTAAQ